MELVDAAAALRWGQSGLSQNHRQQKKKYKRKLILFSSNWTMCLWWLLRRALINRSSSVIASPATVCGSTLTFEAQLPLRLHRWTFNLRGIKGPCFHAKKSKWQSSFIVPVVSMVIYCLLTGRFSWISAPISQITELCWKSVIVSVICRTL